MKRATNAATSASVALSISSVFMRDVPPRDTLTLLFATPNALAISASSARLASLFSGATRTRALR
ncbi:hypothetical protein ATE48_09475 [Candidatus Viadribacter manganicus]|uniref:Uncharacterized protein n=1 Tax=Candidatus Viadribacter manganicus TaxID=1759059 RepID=A0A1B1AHU8_9PROT|nr:hypothetical protein ATE48_09475 [Candidatus Viadribacter manganicus]